MKTLRAMTVPALSLAVAMLGLTGTDNASASRAPASSTFAADAHVAPTQGLRRPFAVSSRQRHCHGHLATIVGDGQDNILQGTPRRDVIWGGAGHDQIMGGAGNDIICGGPQGDALRGGRGDDKLFGGSQDDPDADMAGDWLSGGPGDDLLAPQDAGRTDSIDYTHAQSAVHVTGDIVRGEGVDRLVLDVPAYIRLSTHDDSFIGTPGTDLVWAEGGNDTVRTGAGKDWVFFNDVRPGGLDRAWLGRGDDSVWGWTDRLSVVAGRGNDSITGGPLGGPRVEGGPGADTIAMDAPLGDEFGADGGPGVDTLVYDIGRITSWNMETGEAHVGTLDVTAFFTGFENGRLFPPAVKSASLIVTGTEGANSVLTEGVATRFLGMGGDDSFAGTTLVDTFDGGAGEDRYVSDGNPGLGNTCISVELDPVGACAH